MFDSASMPTELHEAIATLEPRRTKPVPFDPDTASLPALFAAVLNPASVELCGEILDVYQGKLRTLIYATTAELRGLGLSTRMIERLRSLLTIAKRFGEEEWEIGQAFRGSYDVYAHYRERLACELVEHFIVVLLDTRNRKLKDVCVSVGSLSSSIVHPRDVYVPVIRESAAAVVFVHNHPSGDPTPSSEDIQITQRLREVGELVGVRVLDHIIVGRGKYVSFVDDGYWG